MFTKVFSLLVFGILAAASPSPWTTVTVTSQSPAPTTISQCTTGDAQCCQTVGAANTIPGVDTILKDIGVVLADASAVVGLTCTTIGVGANCAQQPVCCEYNEWNGLINIGCNSISL